MLTRRLVILFLLFHSWTIAFAGSPPKLVVVISVDQFRYDYLTRFQQHFGDGGIRSLLEQGASFANATYKHALNMTGPGHATISTGCYGNQNGIFANNWYERESRKELYCVEDRSVKPVGASSEGASPALLLSSTIGDELRLATSFRSKVISVSLKDRAAVLLGGKLGNAAYWMKDSAFVSSTYYMKELPEWVREFNASSVVNSYFGKKWERALPESAYTVMDIDDAPYEGSGNGLGKTFPHRIRGNDSTRITESYYSALWTSPFGNEILSKFVEKAIVAESLGKQNATDLLCIGFSSNDYVGHTFGPNSHEVLDMTVQTDHILSDLFAFIDSEIGLGNCIIVLTSDHGVAPIPEFVLAHNMNVSVGRVNEQAILERAEAVLTQSFGKLKQGMKWIDYLGDGNVYLNPDAISQKKLKVEQVAALLADSLRRRKEVAAVLTREEMLTLNPVSPIEQRMKRSFHRERSGDILFAYRPYFINQSGNTGTTHGQPYDYDAHVPVIFVGEQIRHGTYFSEASPADIAPTLSALLGITFPAGREGRVLEEMMR